MEKLIITAAMIGGITTREKNPHPPMTPREIAESAIECHKAGASVCHIHVRDPHTQASSMKFELYKQVFDRVRDKCDLIINLTTGAGGRLLYDPAAGTWNTAELKSPEERVEHVLKLKPELCSLDVGTLNFGPRAFINLVSVVEKMAKMIKDAGVKPELEVFDAGHIQIARRLLSLGLVEKNAHFQICMGTRMGVAGTPRNAMFMAESLPAGVTWSIFGVAATQFPMAMMGVLLGGHIRVGFEDNLYLRKGQLAKSNAELVRHSVGLIRSLDREVATVEEARKILSLPGRR